MGGYIGKDAPSEGHGQIDTLSFRPDPDVKRALLASVETAKRNWERYVERERAYEAVRQMAEAGITPPERS